MLPTTNSLQFKEIEWLKSASTITRSSDRLPNYKVSWAAYFASQESSPVTPTITSMLPLFQDDSKAVAMIKHGMDVIKAAVNYLNPGQTPFVVVDQLLYAIAKQEQKIWPEIYDPRHDGDLPYREKQSAVAG